MVAIKVELSPSAGVGAVGVPLSAGDALGANVETAAEIAACTIAVVAICVVLLDAPAVGAVGVPVSEGELIGARPAVDTPVL